MQKYITKRGFEKIKQELEYLKTVKRREIAKKIQEAVAHGDLKENSDYHEAKREQAFVEGRILELEQLIRNVVVIDESPKEDGCVRIGSTVVVDFDGEEMKIKIVGVGEADPLKGAISYQSPLGQALLGKKEGEGFVLETPEGKKEGKIIKIE